jgi:hypothetical protein
MSGFISSNPFQSTKRFLQIQSLAPGIARRSSGRFQLRRGITPNLCIVSRIRGYRCVCLVEGFVAAHSVRRLDPRISDNRRISSRLRQGSSSPVRTSIVVPRVSSCSSFSRPCPGGAPFSLPGGGRRRRSRSRARVRRSPATAAAPRAPCAAAPAPGLASLCAAPPLPLPSLFHG